MPSIDPKAPGCVVTSSDIARIVTSCAIFMAFFSFGGCLAALGAALPQIAHDQGVSETSLGYVFIARGSGYLVGTLGSALLIEIHCMKSSKMLLASLGIFLSGIALSLMPHATSVSGMYVLIVLQGLGFGSIDSLCNIVLPEVWGARVQPWMQAAHAHFGLGGIVGPILVGYFKYELAFFLLGRRLSSLQKDPFTINALVLSNVLFVNIPGITSCFTLVLTLVQMVYVRSSSITGNYDTLEEEQTKAMMTTTLASTGVIDEQTEKQTLKERIEGDVEMSPHPAGSTEVIKDEKVDAVPELNPSFALKMVLSSFFFIYVGIEIGYGGWIASYVILEGLTDSHSKAAYINAVFFMTLSLGRVLAIVLAVWISNTSMLRFQLACSLFSAFFIVALGSSTYFTAALGAGFFGFACSSMFPLVMTVVGDYGFTMDSSSTLSFVLGSTFGEAIIPVCIGFIMHYIAPNGMNVCVMVSVLLLLVIYGMADWMMKAHQGHSSDTDTDTAIDTDDADDAGAGDGAGSSGNRSGHEMPVPVPLPVSLQLL